MSSILDPQPDHHDAQSKRPKLRVLPGGSSRRLSTDQLSLALEWSTAPGLAARPPAPGDIRALEPSSPTANSHVELPRASDWAARMARAIYEVSSGERPAAQLSQWVERATLERINLRGSAMARHPAMRMHQGVSRLRKVRSVRVCTVAVGIVEASAVIVGMERSHALALRMEITDGRWLVTAIEMR
jgi:hypothetical protein